jgi:hypothetical protein
MKLGIHAHKTVHLFDQLLNHETPEHALPAFSVIVAPCTHKQTLAVLQQAFIECGSVGRVEGVVGVRFGLQ